MICSRLSFEDHIAGLRRYAQVLLGDPAEVDELVQECLARAYARSSAPGYEAINDSRAYLFGILHNVFVDHRRAERRRMAQDPLTDLSVEPTVPAVQLLRLEVIDLIWAVRELPVDQRRVVLLVGLEGCSYQEVADLMQVPIGTIMSRLSRGRQTLKRLISEGPTGRRRLRPAMPAWRRDGASPGAGRDVESRAAA